MTTPDPHGGDQGERTSGPESPEEAPFLPAAPATVKGSIAPTHAARGADTLPTIEVGGSSSVVADVDAPLLPDAPATVKGSVAAEPVPFDAKAMVESQKHYDANPAYGMLPRATPESIEAAKRLRAKAGRKRRRNRVLGWVVLILVVGGVATGGYYGYGAYQDDQDRRAAERAAEAAADEGDDTDRGALTALGEQEQMLEANESLLDVARPSAGGLRDAVDDAEQAVADLNDRNATGGDAEAADPASDSPTADSPLAVSLDDVRPFEIGPHARQLPDLDGFERFVIDGDDLLAADPAAYRRFVDVLRALPQTATSSPGFALLPSLRPGQIGLAIQHTDDVVEHVVAVADSPSVRVDVEL